MMYTVAWDDDLNPTIRHFIPLTEEGEGCSWEAIIEEIINVYENYGMPNRAIYWADLDPDDYFSN